MYVCVCGKGRTVTTTVMIKTHFAKIWSDEEVCWEKTMLSWGKSLTTYGGDTVPHPHGFLQSCLLHRTSLICPRWAIMMYRSHYTSVISLSRATPSMHHALEKPAEPTLLEALQWSAVVSVSLGKGGASQHMWLLIPASFLTLHHVNIYKYIIPLGKQLQFSWVQSVGVQGLGAHTPSMHDFLSDV